MDTNGNTKELIKDLCSRLPYGVKGLVTFNRNLSMTQNQVEIRIIDSKLYDRFARFQDSWYDNVTIKPYLFPLSSMTEEQILAFWKIEFKDNGGFENDYDFPLYPPKVGNHFIIEALDWLNRNHFDYRGLIEKGLAIDATGLNIY